MKAGFLVITILGVFAGMTLSAQADRRAAAIARAQAHVRRQAALTFFGADQALAAVDVMFDDDNDEHVRFTRTYKGLHVIGGDLVVHGTSDGAFNGVSQTLARPLALSTNPTLSREAAVRRAMAQFTGDVESADAELAIYARGGRPVLAYEVVVAGTLAERWPSELHVIVDAASSRVLDAWDGIQAIDAVGTGYGFFSGPVTLHTDSGTDGFALTDLTRGGHYTLDMGDTMVARGVMFTDPNNVWGDATLANRQTLAVDAHYGTAMTWDYYLMTFRRHGIGNDRLGASNHVHFGDRVSGAWWSDKCFCMSFGDGDGIVYNPFTELDVAAHEMTHGVTNRTAGLAYSHESGGLNEATSDIFGTMVEHFAQNPNEPPNYLIGEHLFKNVERALRYMYQPSLDYMSPDCYYSGVWDLDVHYSSGVANHFFYLLAEGTSPRVGPMSPTCLPTDTRVAHGTDTLSGIGRTKAQQIWYRALTVYMTSGTSYAGARAATIKAAEDLFGSSYAQIVSAAWLAVNVARGPVN